MLHDIPLKFLLPVLLCLHKFFPILCDMHPGVSYFQFCSCFLTCRVSHAFCWKFLKPHMFAIVQDVLFPILSYSQADEELWNTDPYEYIRVKFGMNVPCTLLC